MVSGNSLLRFALVSAVFLGLLFMRTTASVADTILQRDAFSAQIGTRQSSFLARDLSTGQTCILEGSDLETRHAPWSTFKIPNTLIALRTNTAKGIDDWRDWDRARRPEAAFWPDAWKQGQTLKTAFQRSAVWYFQDVAQDVGAEQYRTTLTAWEYGNAIVPNGSDTFWLGGPLMVSVTEQVAFLERLLTGRLDVARHHIDDLSMAARAGTLGASVLHGKTGAGPGRERRYSGAFEGWYVGWLDHGDGASVVFAHHAKGPYFDAIRTFRRDFAETLLAACGMTVR
ncbi:penicillin-binding transpeptidase domain-containing protein [uncultured Tateyamaria sp.]|uniref:penicillin-binding transpeptidase domain-containing protein n=1 Tax=uncultured Tateyamaria sp. TaxID=455651 RepID=UPI00261D8DFF|nr:penicillin-binding transpeptidase domain-containing protein [uncultured Tateyamaria sp.]